MKGELITIKADGAIERTPITAPPGLEALQKAVGGYIEKVPCFDTFEKKTCIALCNEEGKLKQLPVNEEATFLWHAQNQGMISDCLVGTVVLIRGDKKLMEAL
jgi:hypothetical protein